jgi:hypothetical protein
VPGPAPARVKRAGRGAPGKVPTGCAMPRYAPELARATNAARMPSGAGHTAGCSNMSSTGRAAAHGTRSPQVGASHYHRGAGPSASRRARHTRTCSCVRPASAPSLEARIAGQIVEAGQLAERLPEVGVCWPRTLEMAGSKVGVPALVIPPEAHLSRATSRPLILPVVRRGGPRSPHTQGGSGGGGGGLGGGGGGVSPSAPCELVGGKKGGGSGPPWRQQRHAHLAAHSGALRARNSADETRERPASRAA